MYAGRQQQQHPRYRFSFRPASSGALEESMNCDRAVLVKVADAAPPPPPRPLAAAAAAFSSASSFRLASMASSMVGGAPTSDPHSDPKLHVGGGGVCV